MAPLLRIGDWTVDGSANELWQEGSERRPLRHKAMATLLLLAETPGQVVARETLIERVWGGNAFVAQKAINTAIWTIRQALGDDPEAPRYVETIAKKGYRLIAPVQMLARAPTAPAAAAVTASSPAPSSPKRPWLTAAWVLLGLSGLLGGLAWQARQAAPAPALQSRWLTQLPGVEFLGQHSPDGRWLAFAWWQGQGDAALVLRSAKGREPPQVLADAHGDVHGLAWLEGGRALAFTALKEGRCQLWRVDLEPAAPPRPLAECQPLFTPILAARDDGRTLVFTAPGEGRPGLFALQSDGSGLRRLTTAPDPLLPDHQPAFAPDGRRLAFARSQPGAGTRDLFELDLASGQERRLTQQGFTSLHGLAYTAQGEDLILSTTQLEVRMLQRWQRRSGQLQPLGQEGSAPMRERDGRLTVAVLRGSVGLAQWTLGAAGLQVLAPALGSRRHPALHEGPGGDALAFVARGSPGFSQLWVAAPALADPQERLQLPGEIGRPAWSPDGQRLAFWARCGAGGQLALCAWQRSSSAVQVLLQDGQAGGPPTWRDANTLVFSRPQAGSWRAWALTPGQAPQPLPGAPALHAQARLDLGPGGEFWGQGEDGLLRWAPDGAGTERWTAQGLETGERVIGWTPHPEAGLWLLSRGRFERLLHQRRPEAAAQELARWPLGTLAEFPSLSAGPGRLVLERSGGAQGDLLELR
ncbi:winged helix-turn-helix domain-containing protein [Inhella sp.]|uniref:winged helix-turn-helix domain-containing protein n=1 Tax=Inhella sp. TaxID=1921806 RepID=UPI0035AE1A2F